MRFQFRRGTDFEVGEIPLEGSPLWDDQKGRLGIYWGSQGGKLCWFPPVIDDFLQMPQGGLIGGTDDNGLMNRLVFDWSVPDVLRIRDRINNSVVAEFTPYGIVAGVINQDLSIIPTTRNMMVNGDLSIKRVTGFVPTFITDPNDAAKRRHLFAPNWLAWHKSDGTGSLTVAYDENDIITKTGLMPRVLSVITENNPTQCGIRVYFPDYKAVFGQTVNVSFDLKGTAGALTQIRFLNSLNSQLDVQNVPEATGAWERVDFPVFLPSTNATWWAADLLFEPSKLQSAQQQWKIGAVQVTKGGSPSFFEPRTMIDQKRFVDAIFHEGRVHIPDDSTVRSVDLTGFVTAPSHVELFNTTDGNAVATDLDITGFNVSIPDLVNPAGSTLKYATFFAPNVA